MSGYYDGIARGYDELHGEEQLQKLEMIGREMHTDPHLKDFVRPSFKLLDVGCGTGISTGFLKVKERHGIDPSKELIRIAARNFPYCDFKVGSAENLPYKDKEFDIVISLTAIQNFEDIDKGMTEIRRVGKGRFILTFLKKSPKCAMIEESISRYFKVLKRIEEDKDIMFFCENN